MRGSLYGGRAEEERDREEEKRKEEEERGKERRNENEIGNLKRGRGKRKEDRVGEKGPRIHKPLAASEGCSESGERGLIASQHRSPC